MVENLKKIVFLIFVGFMRHEEDFSLAIIPQQLLRTASIVETILPLNNIFYLYCNFFAILIKKQDEAQKQRKLENCLRQKMYLCLRLLNGVIFFYILSSVLLFHVRKLYYKLLSILQHVIKNKIQAFFLASFDKRHLHSTYV